MKEIYLSTITILLAFIAYNGLTQPQRGGVIEYVLYGVMIFFFARGFYSLLPVPFSPYEEEPFLKEHPHARNMPREERLLLYKSWKRSRNKQA
ncbi:hypothetical protein HW115_19250 [Verrucomicrobiaceae bacterium N1E253]|uniref:Uncharacterized protein n=1 Tax=Oceaniferula marina TaxID=2748318 RepID=A0A851GTW8_9BACT|nr:hypothetical protein [Oceaniferula marina]NWK57764.1 hypothetical protein [Oceaniferula marina]